MPLYHDDMDEGWKTAGEGAHDTTTCEVCGMEWTAEPREMCPRCALKVCQLHGRRWRDEAERLDRKLRAMEEKISDALANIKR
jgi:hypothetical protein